MLTTEITVIIVTWNGMKWLQNCFDAIKKSTYPVDTIVIDNGSTDSTVSFIKNNYPEVRLVESGKNLGFGQANNVGMRYALEQKADYVYLLNQDAYIYPDMFEKMIEVAEKEENFQYAIFSPLHVHGDKKTLDSQFKDYIKDISASIVEDYSLNEIKDVYPVDCVPAAGWLIPIKTLKTIGGFDPIFFHYGEDHHYAQRVKYHGYKIGLIPNAMMIHDRETFGNVEVANKGAITRSIKTDILLNLNLTRKDIIRKLTKLIFLFTYESIINVVKGNLKLAKEYWSALIGNIMHIKEYRKNREENKRVGSLWLN